MRKIIALVLALVLTLSMATLASATPFDNRTGKNPGVNPDADPAKWTDTGKVKMNVEAKINPVYYVTVEWKDMTFTYSFGDREWNPEIHQYENDGEGWKQEGDITVNNGVATLADAVEVTNHSNESVKITFENNKAADYRGDVAVAVTATEAAYLENADAVDYNTETAVGACQCKSVSTDVTVSGTPDPALIGNDAPIVIADVVVTIAVDDRQY